jgi:hypothetical protein
MTFWIAWVSSLAICAYYTEDDVVLVMAMSNNPTEVWRATGGTVARDQAKEIISEAKHDRANELAEIKRKQSQPRPPLELLRGDKQKGQGESEEQDPSE